MSVTPVTGRSTGRRVLAVARPALLVAGVALALLAIAHYAHGLGHEVHRLSLPWLVPAAASVLGALVATMLGWRCLLVGLGHPVDRRRTARIFFVSQIGKYLPGSVWPYLAQIDMAGAVGVPAVTMGVVGLVSVVVGLVTAGLTAAVTLPAVAGGVLGRYWWALLALLPLAALLHPAVLGRAVATLRRAIRRPGPVPRLGERWLLVSAGWWFVSWVLWGLQIWSLCEALGAPFGRTLLLAIGGFALAWLVGFLVVVSPAGAGAREAVLVLVLRPVLGTDGALVVALASRFLTTAADVVMALASLAVGRSAAAPLGRADQEGPPVPLGSGSTGG